MSEEAKALSCRAEGARRRGQGKSLDFLAAWGLCPSGVSGVSGRKETAKLVYGADPGSLRKA